MTPQKISQGSVTTRPNADRLVALLGCLLCVIMAAGLSLSDRTIAFDEQLRVARESLIQRDASGSIHIAEIDARSIAALKAWPWPRELHAQLVDRLSEAGAKTIAFDIDFSSPSNSTADSAFAAALARAGGGVILPTFRQRASEGAEFTENVPVAAFRRHAFLASVNVHPDPDGVMRTFTYGTVTQGAARPAMPAMLAGMAGRVGESFPVNTSIDPQTIPRHSVSDILAGRLPPRALNGKTVLIGATAIELGDRYAMPRRGIQPGVVIQALAAETLLQGLVLPNFGAIAPIVGAFALLLLIARARRYQPVLGAVALGVLLLSPLLLEWLSLGTLDVAAAAIAFVAGVTVVVAGTAAARFDAVRLLDPATGLPNERGLRRHLTQVSDGFLIVMRIRNFDEISELMSEDQRAALIGQACQRIALAGGGEQIFSLGSGRLAWTIAGLDLVQLGETLEGLAAMFAARFSDGDRRIAIAPSFGIARGADRGDPAHADLAAARAATMGCRWLVYSPELGGETERAQQLLADLDEAMAAGDIMMVFQPKLTVATDTIDGVEALVRWHHPALGPISPDQFIPVFEKAGRMADLSLYIADRCIEVARRWNGMRLETTIAINISAPLFSDQGFTAALFARVDALGPLARRLALEITESAAVLDDGAMIAALEALRELGLAIVIDDYGTGQSTLSYLKKFPADEIKIDQSFVRHLTTQASDQILVRSTIAMAHELGFKVTAEGVEDQETLGMLRVMGCDIIQGWHVGRGISAQELEPRLGRPTERVHVVA